MATNVHYRPFEIPHAHRILIVVAMLVAFLIVLLWPNPAPREDVDSPIPATPPTASDATGS